ARGVERDAAGERLGNLVPDHGAGEGHDERPHAGGGVDRVGVQRRVVVAVDGVLPVAEGVAVRADQVGADRVTDVVGQRDAGGDVGCLCGHIELVVGLLAFTVRPGVPAGQRAAEGATAG